MGGLPLRVSEVAQSTLPQEEEELVNSAASTTLAPTNLQCLTDDIPRLCDDGITFACYCDGNPQCLNGEDESIENCGSGKPIALNSQQCCCHTKTASSVFSFSSIKNVICAAMSSLA
ncbi:hypothetical protein E2C01_038191 [Portunus trituberculatus]|uniref:Uncharacterized protein n=1 Tax=Portunus trituberculatus TaxID=210409 RepID=A0A5B7FHV5_PORTR|nr:hypothetical protein [Portunus trituberculatus]